MWFVQRRSRMFGRELGQGRNQCIRTALIAIRVVAGCAVAVPLKVRSRAATQARASTPIPWRFQRAQAVSYDHFLKS